MHDELLVISPIMQKDSPLNACSGKRLAIIGAGPIGVELGLLALERGMTISIFERGESAGAQVLLWKHEVGLQLPDCDEFPTGGEFVVRYLQPLVQHIQKHPRCSAVSFNARVLSIGRGALLKGESIGGGDLQMPECRPQALLTRCVTPFRLLVSHGESGAHERFHEGFDFVCDCSGCYRSESGNWCGPGGLPALGERHLRSSGKIWSVLPDVLGLHKAKFAGRRTLVVGSGMSAATALASLSQLAGDSPGTNILYVTRASGRPFSILEGDVLPQRSALSVLGNSAASGDIACITHIGGGSVLSLRLSEEGVFRVEIAVLDESGAPVLRVETVHEVITCCGYRPDMSISEELQVHLCYASGGPMNLAATLIGSSGDCLKQQFSGADVLANPEPGFFILGSKSYGRNSRFLLSLGFQQVAAVVAVMCCPGS